MATNSLGVMSGNPSAITSLCVIRFNRSRETATTIKSESPIGSCFSPFLIPMHFTTGWIRVPTFRFSHPIRLVTHFVLFSI